jgi:hypothetical protein
MRYRLRERLNFWKTFVEDPLVYKWLSKGVNLLWRHGPPPAWEGKNHASCNDHEAFVDKTIAELLATETIMIAPSKPTVVSPLGVAEQGNGKLRLIWDGRYINNRIYCPKFKYETLRDIHETVQPGDFIASSDNRSGFHHVDMDEDFWTYMGFCWKGVYYCYTQLPFGLSIAPWVYTKVMQQLRRRWRAAGVRCTGYVDDMLYAASTEAQSLRNQAMVRADMRLAGLLLSDNKCQWGVRQQVTYLGAEVDTKLGVIRVPTKKRDQLFQQLEGILAKGRVQVREISSAAGRVNSMSDSLGMLTRLYTKAMARQVAESSPDPMRPNMNKWVHLHSDTKDEMQFWLDNVDRHNGRSIWRQPAEITIHTDAAGKCPTNIGGWGGWRRLADGTLLEAAGRWQPHQSLLPHTHSTWQELSTARLVLQSFNRSGELSGTSVLLCMDNQGACHIVNKGGSTDPELHAVSKSVFWYSYEQDIELRAEWVPRERNQYADMLSKLVDPDDFMLAPAAFQRLHSKYGPFTKDLFASHTSTQLPAYYSRHATPDSAGINAFAHSWDGLCWAHPPYSLVGKVVRHAQREGARLGLLVPLWKGARWWHELVLPGSTHFAPFVQSCELLPARQGQLLAPEEGHTRPPRMGHTWDLIFLAIDCSPGAPAQQIPVPIAHTDTRVRRYGEREGGHGAC